MANKSKRNSGFKRWRSTLILSLLGFAGVISLHIYADSSFTTYSLAS